MNCEICNGEFREYYSGPVRDGSKGQVYSVVYHCQGCGVLRLRESDCLDEEDYRTLRYREKLGQPNTDRFALDDPYQLDRLQVIGTHNLRGKTVLDFGAGSGSFCDHIAGLAKVNAFEINRFYVNKIRERGIPCFYDFEFIGEQKYDIITSLLVIEHLEEPMKWHKKLWDRLNDGGRMYIQTPCPDTQGDLDGKTGFYRTQHRWYFEIESMENFVGRLTSKIPNVFWMKRSHMEGTDVWAILKK